MVSDRSWVAGQLRKTTGKFLVALVGRKSGWLRRIAPGLCGGRAGRSWGKRSSPVDLLRGELYGGSLKSRECSEGLGGPLYSVLVVLDWQKGGRRRRIALGLSGGRAGRSWGKRSSPVDLLRGELYGGSLKSR